MASAQGFDVEFVSILPDDYTCPICHLALRDPMLTHCGHQFCSSCLEPLFTAKRLQCPVCRTDLTRSEVFPNNALKRRVLDLQIRCGQPGCEWVGELRCRDQHNADCGYFPEHCPNDCGSLVMRKDMDDHKMFTCNRRSIECLHCSASMEHRDVENHWGDCAMYPVACQFNCGAKIAREDMKKHVGRQGTCPNAELTCRYGNEGCHFRGVRGQLEEHMKANVAEHLDIVSAELAKVKVQMSKFEFIWKIENWSHKMALHQQGGPKILTSTPFYSGHPGYNMMLEAYPDCNFTAEEPESKSHLSVFLCLIKGKYDRLLPWPFDKPFTLSLLDQCPDGEDVVIECEPQQFASTFDYPDERRGFGSRQMASHEKLASRHFTEDDCVMIKLTVLT